MKRYPRGGMCRSSQLSYKCCFLPVFFTLVFLFHRECPARAESSASARPPTSEEPAPKKAPETTAGHTISFNAGKILHRTVREQSVVLLIGGMHASFMGKTVRASSAVLYTETLEIYAEGDVRLEDPDVNAVTRCSWLFYNFTTGEVAAENADLLVHVPRKRGGSGHIESGEVDHLILRAETIRRGRDGVFHGREVQVTSCDFGHPHWHIRCRELDLVPGAYATCSGNRLYFGEVPVFGLPRWTFGLDRSTRQPGVLLRTGKSGRYGDSARVRVSLPVAHSEDACFALDGLEARLGHMSARGWEYGFSGEMFSRSGEGWFRYYAVDENNIRDSVAQERAEREHDARAAEWTRILRASDTLAAETPYRLYEHNIFDYDRKDLLDNGTLDDSYAPDNPTAELHDNTRRLVELHQKGKAGPWGMTLDFFASSDAWFRREYMGKEAKTGWEPETSFELYRGWNHGRVRLTASAEPTEYAEATEKLPEAGIDVTYVPLGGGFIGSGSASAGYYRRTFGDLSGLDDFETWRTRGELEVKRPVRLGAVSLVPFVAAEGSAYGESLLEDKNCSRTAYRYGATLSSAFCGVFPDAEGKTGPGAKRHIIEPRIRYEKVSAAGTWPDELPGFDEHDDLASSEMLFFELDQRLQKKFSAPKGKTESRDIAGLMLSLGMFVDEDDADRLNDSRRFEPLHLSMFIQPTRKFRLFGYADASFEGTGLEEAAVGVTFRAGDNFKLSLGERYSKTDEDRKIWGSNQLAAGIEWQVTPTWRTSLVGRWELEDNEEVSRGATSQELVFRRDFHDWALIIGVSYDRAEDEAGISLSVLPKGYTSNLVPLRPQ